MVDHSLPDPSLWGYESAAISRTELVAQVRARAAVAVQAFEALPSGPEQCKDRPEYNRVSVQIPLTEDLVDQLKNGSTGYRAHYSISTASGERFNRQLVDAVAPLIVNNERLYQDKFPRSFCEKSLLGRFSKFWFPNELTDPSAQSRLAKLDEVLNVPRWKEYWQTKPKPWKGLLAPIPESRAVLLNGTFVNDGGDYQQKPGRSQQVFDTGWT